jgi:predicted HTH transcriptional regulator
MNIHKEMVDFIKKERVVTSSEMANKFKISWNTAEKYLLELVIEGKIEKIKKLGVNLWILKN